MHIGLSLPRALRRDRKSASGMHAREGKRLCLRPPRRAVSGQAVSRKDQTLHPESGWFTFTLPPGGELLCMFFCLVGVYAEFSVCK